MSDLKHPGPWKLVSDIHGQKAEASIDFDPDNYCDNVFIIDANGEWVAGCDEYEAFSSREAKALLLATPDLYAFAAAQLTEMDFRADPAEREKRAELFALLQRARGEQA